MWTLPTYSFNISYSITLLCYCLTHLHDRQLDCESMFLAFLEAGYLLVQNSKMPLLPIRLWVSYFSVVPAATPVDSICSIYRTSKDNSDDVLLTLLDLRLRNDSY